MLRLYGMASRCEVYSLLKSFIINSNNDYREYSSSRAFSSFIDQTTRSLTNEFWEHNRYTIAVKHAKKIKELLLFIIERYPHTVDIINDTCSTSKGDPRTRKRVLEELKLPF
jgi:hypothetical protein